MAGNYDEALERRVGELEQELAEARRLVKMMHPSLRYKISQLKHPGKPELTEELEALSQRAFDFIGGEG
jgi:hypothetical protein